MHKSDYLAQVEALRASPELRARVAGLAGTPARRRRLRPWMGVCACLAVLLLGGTLLLPRLGGSSGRRRRPRRGEHLPVLRRTRSFP